MPPLLSEEESALDPYTLLNISSTATEKDVRKAYRQKSLKYHPDRVRPFPTLRFPWCRPNASMIGDLS